MSTAPAPAGPPPRSTARARILGAALLVAAFVAGGLAGAAADRVFAERLPGHAARDTRPCRGPQGTAELFGALHLTADQQVRLDSILERRRVQMDAFWEREGPRLRALVDSTEQEIGRILTPDQRATFDRLRAEKRAFHSKRHGKPGEARHGESPHMEKGRP